MLILFITNLLLRTVKWNWWVSFCSLHKYSYPNNPYKRYHRHSSVFQEILTNYIRVNEKFLHLNCSWGVEMDETQTKVLCWINKQWLAYKQLQWATLYCNSVVWKHASLMQTIPLSLYEHKLNVYGQVPVSSSSMNQVVIHKNSITAPPPSTLTLKRLRAVKMRSFDKNVLI